MNLRSFAIALLISASTTHAAESDWTTPQAPFRIHGNTYYVGTRGLSAILLTSDAGHVLIDVPMAANVPAIEANVRALGFRIEDIKLILNSHAHFDHAGGIAALAADSGAVVQASAAGAKALRVGGDDVDDPQHGLATPYAPVSEVTEFADGETLHVGTLTLTAHITPGHTPGSTTWSWRSCVDADCLDLVYADSLTAMSNDAYRYSDPAHPKRVQDFRRGLATIAALPCDVLITPHPEASGFSDRVKRRDAGDAQALIDRAACRVYADAASARLDRRISDEHKAAHDDAATELGH